MEGIVSPSLRPRALGLGTLPALPPIVSDASTSDRSTSLTRPRGNSTGNGNGNADRGGVSPNQSLAGNPGAGAPRPAARPPSHHLMVNSYNPFEEVTFGSRVRQVLHTHQGRDKVFKVVQYLVRLLLSFRSEKSQLNWHFVAPKGQEASALENNLTILTNGRRLMRIGRFVAEFVRLRATFRKCSEIEFSPSRLTTTLQIQMLLDIVARMLSCCKAVMEDIVFFVQKGFLNAALEPKLLRYASVLGLPVLLIDLYLNTLRMAQGIVDARVTAPAAIGEGETSEKAPVDQASGQPTGRKPRTTQVSLLPPPGEAPVSHRKSVTPSPRESPHLQNAASQDTFSLLTNYSKVDKLRKRNSNATARGSLGLGRSSSEMDLLAARRRSLPTYSPIEVPNAMHKPFTQHDSRHEHNDSSPFGSAPSTPPPPAGVAEDQPTRPSPVANVICWEDYHRTTHFADDVPALPVGDGDKAKVTGILTKTGSADVVCVHSYKQLLWSDFELHWACVTQVKLTLDIILCSARVLNWTGSGDSFFASCGLVSGLLSVYRVWTYGS
jgi:hypothetical protein